MINVSNEFWKLMQERTDFKENAEITLADGTVLLLDESVFTISNNSIVDSAGANSIPLGVALARNIQIELMNDDKQFSVYDFFGARIRLYLTFQLSETVERIEYGYFTVVSPATCGTTVIITAIDDMYKADKTYTTNLTFPQRAWVVLQDICSTCDIPLSTTEFTNKDFEIQEKPSGDYTYRQIIGYIAMIACGNARINRQGYLEILSYDFSFLNENVGGGIYNPWASRYTVDGGTYNPWSRGTVVDGGLYNPWTDGDMLEGGLYVDKKDYHILYNFKESPKVDTDDVVITGLQTVVEPKENETESTTILLGNDGYVLKLDNPLFINKEQEALQLIGAVMIGGRMRKFEGDHIAYPIAEFMDNAFVVDRDGNVYGTVLTDINFTFFGFTTFKNSAENAVRNASQYQSSGVQALIKAQQMVNKEKKNREVALEKIAQQLATSSGLFMTEENQEDGSIIYYMHDKKTLTESSIVWKFTAQAFGISLDGGKTYPYGLTATGTAILDMIYAIGIDADHIITGRIADSTGKNYWDLKKGEFVLDGGNVVIKAKNFSLDEEGNVTVSGRYEVEYVRTITAEEYSEDDITTMQQIATHVIEPTEEHLRKYDFKGTGIKSWNMLIVQKMLSGYASWYKFKYKVVIDPTESASMIRAQMTYWNSDNATEISPGTLRIGGCGFRAGEVDVDTLTSQKYVTIDESSNTQYGATGTFETGAGNTIEVCNGIITGIF